MRPLSRAAESMVTGHQQPDPRVWRPGRESNPVHPFSHDRAVIQTQGAVNERSRIRSMRLVFWELVMMEQSCEGAFGPLLRVWASLGPWRARWMPHFAGSGYWCAREPVRLAGSDRLWRVPQLGQQREGSDRLPPRPSLGRQQAVRKPDGLRQSHEGSVVRPTLQLLE